MKLLKINSLFEEILKLDKKSKILLLSYIDDRQILFISSKLQQRKCYIYIKIWINNKKDGLGYMPHDVFIQILSIGRRYILCGCDQRVVNLLGVGHLRTSHRQKLRIRQNVVVDPEAFTTRRRNGQIQIAIAALRLTKAFYRRFLIVEQIQKRNIFINIYNFSVFFFSTTYQVQFNLIAYWIEFFQVFVETRYLSIDSLPIRYKYISNIIRHFTINISAGFQHL